MGLSEAQNGYAFGMIPGYGIPDGYLSSLAPSDNLACKLSTAPELERYPSRRPCMIGRGVNTYFSQPNVHTRSPTAPNHMLTGVLVFL